MDLFIPGITHIPLAKHFFMGAYDLVLSSNIVIASFVSVVFYGHFTFMLKGVEEFFNNLFLAIFIGRIYIN